MKRLELSGQRFGKWVVLRLDEIRPGNSRWECRCDCGNIGVVDGSKLTGMNQIVV